MRDPFSLSKSRSLNSLTAPNEPQRPVLSRVTKINCLNIRTNNNNNNNNIKGNEFKCASSLDTLPFGQPSEKSQMPPLGPLAPRPWRRPVRARSARLRPRARSARPPPGPPRVPRAAGSHPTQGVSISTALAKAALRINCAASKLRCEKVALKPIKGRR